MKSNILLPKVALNKAYLKVKPSRPEIEAFKKNLIILLEKIDIKESEGHAKNLVRDFLLNTFFGGKFEINTKDRKDLVIHIDKTSKSEVGTIIEAKRPSEKKDFPTPGHINVKAIQELILYYFKERIDKNNSSIRSLIATNGYEWYIFDSHEFYRYFYKNHDLKKQYLQWKEGQKDSSKTDLFYEDIAKPILSELNEKINYTYFNIQDYKVELIDEDKKDDNKLIAIFKLLSPTHLLKLPFANDSNTLDKNFYNELLHIIGLEEALDGKKRIIQRLRVSNQGSLIENTISTVEVEGRLQKVPNLGLYGLSIEEQYFGVGLELCITWINRILFLKLLEGQLVKFHKDNQELKFLSYEKIQNFDTLNTLFFQVLAKKQKDRLSNIVLKYDKIPFLNSSLFEISPIEDCTIRINSLQNDLEIPYYSKTILKENNKRIKSKNVNSLKYLLEFLEAYDFSSESSEEIQEENKPLITASVLGLIFEKINGYKEGSYFTPGYITMFMCKEPIRNLIINKFNNYYDWTCKSFVELYNKIDNIDEANSIINSIKICDPAVGSGHFLVSALNEILQAKSDLKILRDKKGKRLKEYSIFVSNDELMVFDEDNEFFKYIIGNDECQRVQETIFFEKATIIENCLFGVDINPNAVKICRLRLWIELLKNTYYTSESNYSELETLPNIDINIKQGNSLINRFNLDSELDTAFKLAKINLQDYKRAVNNYKLTNDKKLKEELLKIIEKVYDSCKSTFFQYCKENKELSKFRGQLIKLEATNVDLFGNEILDPGTKRMEIARLNKLISIKESEIQTMKDDIIFINSFEWRFKFPEVLGEEGNFIGFDLIIGNPPYISNKEMHKKGFLPHIQYFNKKYVSTKSGNYDLYIPFIELGLNLLKPNSELTFIVPNRFVLAKYSKQLLKIINEKYNFINFSDFSIFNVFEQASVYPITIRISNQKSFNCSITDKLFMNIDNDLIIDKVQKWDYLEFKPVYASTDLVGQITHKIEEIKPQVKNLKYSPGINGFQFTNYGKCITEGKIKAKSKRILVTGTIDRYTILAKPTKYKGISYSNPYIHYDPKVISKGKWNLFSSPKIIVAGMTKKIESVLDLNGDYAPAVSVYSILSNVDTLQYVIGILNSTLMNWYYKKRFQDKHMAGGYISMNTTLLKKIPIIDPPEKEKKKIRNAVIAIQDAKSKNLSSLTTKLEEEIDTIIYSLYGLTKEEIQVVKETI